VSPTSTRLCACGCGQQTPLAKHTCARDGTVRGQPTAYCPHHHSRKPPVAERMLARTNFNGPVVRPDLGPCHVWTAGKTTDGYGSIYFDGRLRYAHRTAFFLAHGRWPTPMACHHCDNPSCVKAIADAQGPAHIYEGTRTDNMRDMGRRRRQVFQVHPERVLRGAKNGNATLTVDQVRAIRATAGKQRDVAKMFGVSQTTVWSIRQRKTWKEI
jgi:hypothetical protein